MRFFCFSDIRGRDYAEAFFEILKKTDRAMVPTKWDDPDKSRPVKISYKRLDKLLVEWGEIAGLHMYKPLKGDRRLCWFTHTWSDKSLQPPPGVSMFLPAENADWPAVRALALDLYDLLHPAYAYIGVSRQRHLIRPGITYSIADVHWINFFGPPYVEMMGKEKLMSAPCHEAVMLSDGGVMLVLTPDGAESASKEGRRRAEAVKEHLGREYFFHPSDGKNRMEWRERGRRKTPDFDFSAVPDIYAQPEAQPVAIEDPQAFISTVSSLVEDLKKRTGRYGKYLDFTSKSLESLDEWLIQKYQKNSSTRYWESPDLTRELVAYLGEVARVSLDGRWAEKEVNEQPRAVVEFGEDGKIVFDPIVMVDEVICNGLPEAEDSEVGIMETGFSPSFWVWMTGKFPKSAIKDLFNK